MSLDKIISELQNARMHMIQFTDGRHNSVIKTIEKTIDFLRNQKARVLTLDEVLKLDGTKEYWCQYTDRELTKDTFRYDKEENCLYADREMSCYTNALNTYNKAYRIWDKLPTEQQMKEMKRST